MPYQAINKTCVSCVFKYYRTTLLRVEEVEVISKVHTVQDKVSVMLFLEKGKSRSNHSKLHRTLKDVIN